MDDSDEMSFGSDSADLATLTGSSVFKGIDHERLCRILDSLSLMRRSPKTFKIDCYLNESYDIQGYTVEGTSCLAAILSALLKRDPEVIPLCVWTLASFKKKLLKDADGEPCSFVQKLSEKFHFKPEPKTYTTDPAMEEWAKAAAREPGFEIFTLALAMFVVGFPQRKACSQSNQSRDGKWRHSLAAITSFARLLPRRIKINFLKDIKDFGPELKAACGACLFLEGTTLGRKLRDPMLFGIVRPVCDHHTLILRRFQEFKKLYPEAFFRDSSFLKLPHASKGMELLQRLETVLAEAKEAKAELQPLMIRSIDKMYLSYLGESQLKAFQTCLFYCICSRKGRRGRENWQAFMQSTCSRKYSSRWQLDSYVRWVSSLRVQ